MGILDYLVPVVSSYQFWALALVTYFLSRKLTAKRYNLPPRPHSWPIIGNMYHVFKGDPILYKWCDLVAKEVGPIFRISFGPIDAVVLNDIDSTQKAMQQKGNDFHGRMKRLTLEAFSDGYNDVAMADADHPTFKARRKLLATALRNFTVGRPYEERVAVALDKVFKLFDPLAEKLEPFDPDSYSRFLTFNMTASMCFQKGFEMNDPEFIAMRDLFQAGNDAFSSGVSISDIIPFAKYLPFDLWDVKHAKDLRDQFVDILETEIDRSRKRMENSDVDGDLTAYVLRTREEGQKEGLDQVTDIQIVQLIGNVFGAGSDTTHATLRWILLVMALYPDVQEKVYQEIVDNVGEGESFVSAIDYKTKMSYTEAVLLETTRFGTVGPFGFPHYTLADVKIDDYDIPKGTMVMVNQWAINHAEEEFPEPEKFIPERFLDENGNLGSRPRGYLPFGLGRRSCPGELAARTSLWIVYTSFLRRYKVLPPEDVQLKPEYKENAFEGSPKPFKIILQKRT